MINRRTTLARDARDLASAFPGWPTPITDNLRADGDELSMTALDHTAGLDWRSHFVFHLAALIFAGLLGVQNIWLPAAELVRLRIDQLPTDIASAAAAAEKHNAAHFWATIQSTAITEAFNTATPAAKSFIEQTIKDIDPAARSLLHNGTPSLQD